MTTLKLTCGGCGDSFEMGFAPDDKGRVSLHASMWHGHHEACAPAKRGGERAHDWTGVACKEAREACGRCAADLEIAMVKIATLKRELDDAHAKLAHDVEEIDAVKRELAAERGALAEVGKVCGAQPYEQMLDAVRRCVRGLSEGWAATQKERDRAQAVIAKLALDGFVRCLRCGVALDPWDTRFDAAYRNTHTDHVCLGNVVRERDALREFQRASGAPDVQPVAGVNVGERTAEALSDVPKTWGVWCVPTRSNDVAEWLGGIPGGATGTRMAEATAHAHAARLTAAGPDDGWRYEARLMVKTGDR